VALLRDRGSEEGAEMMEIWTDASGSWGCGAVWDREWLQVEWRQWPSVEAATIAVKELLPIVLAAAVLGRQWRGRMVLCHCDNQAVGMALRGAIAGRM